MFVTDFKGTPALLKLGLIIGITIALKIAQVTSSSLSRSGQISRECWQHCKSNQPSETNGAFILPCDNTGTNESIIKCRENCKKLNCSPEVCKNGVINCPASVNFEENASGKAQPKNFDKDHVTRQVSQSDNEGDPGIPTWFWVLVGITLFVTVCSVICGFSNRHCSRGHYQHLNECEVSEEVKSVKPSPFFINESSRQIENYYI